MATKKTTKTRVVHVHDAPKWLRTLAFVSVMIMGLGIAIAVILGKIDVWSKGHTHFAGVGNWIQRIAIAIGLIVPMFWSYYEARTRGQTWFVLWIIAIILITVFYIWGFWVF